MQNSADRTVQSELKQAELMRDAMDADPKSGAAAKVKAQEHVDTLRLVLIDMRTR